MFGEWEKNQAVMNFREYLRLPSVHPNVNYDGCVDFLKKQADSLGLPVKIINIVPKKPIVVMTWAGSDPSLPSILLNSHMDVVPVFEESWTYPPFSAHMTEDGKIYARGSQDMKCVGIQYLEAIRNLKKKNIVLRRTIHITFVPEEEIGGFDGMRSFVSTNDFKSLKIGFALDEGMASPNDNFILFYGERSIWHIKFICKGAPGHGSLLKSNTAGEKVYYIIKQFMDLRAEQKAILDNNPSLTIGDVTSINLTILEGGIQTNVVPEQLTAVFDVRVAITMSHDELDQKIQKWCAEAGGGIDVEFEQKEPFVESTKLDATNPFWLAFKAAMDEMKLSISPMLCPGASDMRFIRPLEIPALGFSPMNKTPLLMHASDEFLHADIFLRGIPIYENILQKIANQE